MKTTLLLGVLLQILNLPQEASPSHQAFQSHTSDALWNITKTNARHPYTHCIEGLERGRPLLIAHRGASGQTIEHTVEAYQAAVASGADVIECDAGLTSDYHIVCLHEGWLNASTDVATKFPERVTSYMVDNVLMEDYFIVDFDLAELKTLRKVEKKSYRSQMFNGLLQIATLKEMIQIAMEADREVGVHVELKDPLFYNQHANSLLSFEEFVVHEMLTNGCEDKPTFRCFVQSFDKQSLLKAHTLTKLPMIFLTEHLGSLPDSELDELKSWVYGVGAWKEQIIQEGQPTDLIQRCHQRGLKVHAYTFRNEYMNIPATCHSDPYCEMALFFSLHLDGYFTDFPATANHFLNAVAFYAKTD